MTERVCATCAHAGKQMDEAPCDDCLEQPDAATRWEPVKTRAVQWKVHLPKLFEEILSNPGLAVMNQPLRITLRLLLQVAQRAIELDDQKLHALMLRLALYEQGDPTSPLYDPSILDGLETLCDDEGCPQHGTPHVCLNRDRLADQIEMAPDEPWEDD